MQDIETAETVSRKRDHPFDFGRLTTVGTTSLCRPLRCANVGNNPVSTFLIDIDDYNGRPFAGKGLCRCLTYSRAGARDERHLVFESHAVLLISQQAYPANGPRRSTKRRSYGPVGSPTIASTRTRYGQSAYLPRSR